MRFVCDGCGKKYSTAGDPAPGKVYKLKCRACGHLIVVKGQAGTMTAIPAITAAEAAAATQVVEPLPTPPPVPPEGLELVVAPVQVADDAIEPLPSAAAEALPPEVASAVDAAAGATTELTVGPPVAPPAPGTPPPAIELVEPTGASPLRTDLDLTPPPPEKDELAEFAAATAEVMAAPRAAGEASRPALPGYRDLFGETGSLKLTEGPLATAARASLPDDWEGLPPVTAPAPARPAPPRLAPARAIKGGLGGIPIALIGVGVLSLVAITAWALLGRGEPQAQSLAEVGDARAAAPGPARPEPRPSPATAVSAPEPAPASLPGPGVDGKGPEPRPDPGPAPRPPEQGARPAERRVERRPEPRAAERKPEPARPAPAPEPRVEPGEAGLSGVAEALPAEVVNRVVGANRKAFATCIAAAGSAGLVLDGRPVALRFTINGNGTVTYPTLDDQSLNAIELGQCLKSAARLMIFPRFRGDPYRHEVALLLSNN